MTRTRYLFCLACLALIALLSVPSHAQSFADTVINIGPGNCAGGASANGVAPTGVVSIGTGLTVVGTANAPVFQVASSAAATDTVTCDLTCPQERTTFGKGCSSFIGFAFFYGIVTTTATSESAPACVTVAPPPPGAGETASAAAGTAVAVTALPVVGSANLTAITTGQFYTQYISFNTPPSLPTTAGTVYQKLFCSFAFGQTAGSAMQVNTPGGLIFTTYTLTWFRHHKRGEAIDAMQRMGISRETAGLIFARYGVKQRDSHRRKIA